MTPERWQRIEALFDAVLDRPPGEREAFLERACAGDRALRDEVDSLRAAYEADPGFLEAPLVEAPALPTAVEGIEGEQHIGPYRLIRPLGRGGMGQVYLAERNDDAFSRYVALKIIRRGLDTDDFLRRFRVERQILARLSHPGIARLFDGGTTDAGRPYFVMEYVEGKSITAYCDHNDLSVEARLRLFRRVCVAVHHAHQNLVVHRDLKPSNILVDPKGQPKLLDFGIAKLLDPAQTGLATTLTQTGRRVMTPAYASPEQLCAEGVTTASDVYALGVLLYELLAGCRPYRLDDRSPREVERVICEDTPERPSEATAGRRARQLRGDLDTMILKAIRKEPERRYASAGQLAEDVQRYLDGRPVVAQPDTFTYRMTKFVRRHRTAVAATALIVLLLAASSIVTAIQSHRIQTQAAEVRQERDHSEQVVDFLVDLFEASDPNEAQGDPLTAPELLERGATRIEEKLGDEPAVHAEMMQVMSRVYERRGRYERGEQMARRALQIQRRLRGAESAEAATALNSVGWLLHQQGAHAAADSVLREALTIRRTQLGPQHLDVARTLNDLAVVQQVRGDYPATDTLLQEALAIRRQHHGDEHPSVATTLNNLAALKWRLGDYETAERQLREVRRVLRAQHGSEHMRVAVATTNLAALQMSQEEYERAEVLYREALTVRRTLLGNKHPDVARSLVHLGNLYRAQREFDKAVPLLREALGMRRTLLGERHRQVANIRYLLARLYRQQGDYARAEPLYREALAGFREVLPDGHAKTAEVLVDLGRMHLANQNPRQAVPLLEDALAMQRRNFGSEHRQTATAQTALGACLADLERYAKAETLLKKSHAVLQHLQGANTALARRTEQALVALYEAWGRPGQAKRYQN